MEGCLPILININGRMPTHSIKTDGGMLANFFIQVDKRMPIIQNKIIDGGVHTYFI